MQQLIRKISLFVVITLVTLAAEAQRSICTKTASQLGEEAGRGLNGGIIYLAAAPLVILSYIGYRWWKSNND